MTTAPLKQPAPDPAAIVADIKRLGEDVRFVPRSTAPLPEQKTPRRFVLTARDTEILRAVARYRYLRTGQVHRLLFAPAGAQMARRRLRQLASDSCRYLGKAEFVLQTEGAPYEIAYFLAPPGIKYLEPPLRRVLATWTG